MLLLKLIICPKCESPPHSHRGTWVLHHWPHAVACNIILHYSCLKQTYTYKKKNQFKMNVVMRKEAAVFSPWKVNLYHSSGCFRREQCSVWAPLSATRGSETVYCLPVHLLYSRVLYLKSNWGLDEAVGNQLGCQWWLFNCSATCRRDGCHLLQTQHSIKLLGFSMLWTMTRGRYGAWWDISRPRLYFFSSNL